MFLDGSGFFLFPYRKCVPVVCFLYFRASRVSVTFCPHYVTYCSRYVSTQERKCIKLGSFYRTCLIAK